MAKRTPTKAKSAQSGFDDELGMTVDAYPATPPPVAVAFGDRLFWLSRRLGFADNSAFARHLDMPRTRVQQLLALLYPPDLPTLERIAAKCDVPIDVLIVGVRTTKLPKPPDDMLDSLLHARPRSGLA